MNRQIKWLGIGLVMCYLAVFARLHQTQMFAQEEIAEKPMNARATQRMINQPRGRIYTADQVELARSDNVGGPNQRRNRVYPEGDLFGQITGHFSPLVGKTGVEASYDDQLTGATMRQQFDGLTNLFSGHENVGNVQLTVRKDLQIVARDELRGREGAAVVMDPRTGAILAMYSNPSYDPNLLVNPDITAEQAAFNDLKDAPGNPMLSKAFGDRYNPGSTFKAVTAATGLTHGVTLTSPVYPKRRDLPLHDSPANPLGNFTQAGGVREECGGALQEITTVSCNTSFGQMGIDAGQAALVDQARKFGYLQKVPLDIPGAAKSDIKQLESNSESIPAKTAIGQQDNFATPLQMAMVAAGIANDGKVMTPHVMDRVYNQDATVVEEFPKDKVWLEATTPQNAAILRQVLLGPVNDPNGTAYGQMHQKPGIVVGGKTGTAESGTDQTGRFHHAWFMAFAGPANQPPEVAVAVVVLRQPAQNDKTGGVIAAPIADKLIAKALEVVDQGPGDLTSAIVTTTTAPAPVGPFANPPAGATTTAPTTRREG